MANKKTTAEIEFKAISTEFNKNIKQMGSIMGTYTNELKLNSSQLKGNSDDTNLLKERQAILQKQMEASNKKVEESQKALTGAKNLLGENSEEVKKWTNSLLKAKTSQQNIQNELDQTNKKLDDQDKNVDELADSFDDNSQHALTFGEALKANVMSDAIISGVKALGNAVKDVATGLYDAAKGAGEWADDLITTSNQTGLTTKELQELDYAMRFVDVEVDVLTKSMAKNIKQMGAGAAGYEELGVNIYDTNGELRNSTDVFYESIDALGLIENETQRDVLAMSLFGKSAQDLNPLINSGSDSIKAYAAEAEAMGLIMDETSVNSLGSLDDSFQRVDASVEAVKLKLSTGLAPVLEQVVDGVTGFVNDFDFEGLSEGIGTVFDGIEQTMNFIDENQDVILALVAGVSAGGAAFVLINGGIAAYNAIMPIYTAVSTGAALSTTALGGAIAFLTSPITLTVAAIAGLVAAGVLLWKNWDEVKTKAGEIFEGVKETIHGAIEKIKGFFNFKWEWPHLKAPSLEVTWKTDGWAAKAAQLLGLEGMPSFHIAWNAKGGLFDRPTVLQGFGEAGPEYAIPLNEHSVTPLADMIVKMMPSSQYSEETNSNLGEIVDALKSMGIYIDVTAEIDGMPLTAKISKNIGLQVRKKVSLR